MAADELTVEPMAKSGFLNSIPPGLPSRLQAVMDDQPVGGLTVSVSVS
jgi:hypothetical protein